MNKTDQEGMDMQRMSLLESRRWRDGEQYAINVVANDALFEMRRLA
jgi:hypothetical protein